MMLFRGGGCAVARCTTRGGKLHHRSTVTSNEALLAAMTTRRFYARFPSVCGGGAPLSRRSSSLMCGATSRETQLCGPARWISGTTHVLGGSSDDGSGKADLARRGGVVIDQDPAEDDKERMSTTAGGGGVGGMFSSSSPSSSDDKIDKRVWPIAASSLMMGTAIGVIIPVMPLFGAELGLSKAEYGSLISIMGMTRLCLNIPCAWAAEKYGRKPLLVGGPVISSIGMTLTATATSLQELISYRFFTGAGGACQMTGAQLYLADVSTPSNRARTLAPVMAGFAAGAALGPAVGGLMADHFGLGAPFFFVGAAIAAVSLNNFMRLSETKPSVGASVDGKIVGGGGRGEKSLLEDVRDTARQWRPLLSNTDMQSALISHMSFWAASAGVMFSLMPLYATSLGLSATAIGTCFMITPIVNVLGSQPAAWVSDKIGRKKALVPGILTCATAAALFPFATTQVQLMGALGVWATGSTLLGTTPTSYVSDISTTENRAQALALLRSAGDAGLMMGGGLLGLVADCTSISVAMGSASCLLLAAGAFFALRANESVGSAKMQEDMKIHGK